MIIAFLLAAAVAQAQETPAEPLPQGAVVRLGTRRFRHPSDVPSIAFSPDGASLATVSSDGSVRLWAYPAGTPRWKSWAETTSNSPTLVLYSANGRWLATTGYDGYIRIWDASTGRPAAEIAGRRDEYDPAALAFSPDSATLAAAWPETSCVELHDVPSGRKKDAITIGSPALRLRFSPDGSTLACAGDDSAIVLLDPATGQVRRELEGHDDTVNAITFSRDGATLVSAGSDWTVRAWETATGRLRLTFKGHTKAVWSAALSPDGKTLASSGEDNVIRLWDAATGKELRVIPSERVSDGEIAFTPDGATLAVPCADHAPLFYDPATGARRHEAAAHEGGVTAIALSPDGASLASASTDRTVRLWETATGRPLFVLAGHTGSVEAVAFAPDGRVVSGGHEKVLRLWDSAAGKAAGTLDGYDGTTNSLAVSPDGRLLVASLTQNHMHVMRVTELATGKQVFQNQAMVGYRRTAIAFSPDGASLVGPSSDRTAAAWSATKEGGPLQTFDHQMPVSCVAASPDGRVLVCGNGRMLSFWERGTGKSLMNVSSHARMVSALAYSPDGSVIASAGADGVVRLFEALTGREVRRLPGHDGLVTSLAFTKDGARLVSSGEDTTVLVWNVDPQPGAEEPGDAWDALGGDDARRAWRVMWRLVATGDRGVALLAAKLAEVPEIPEKTRRLIAELEDEDVGTRERATEELKKLGPDAEPALRRAAEHAPPGESRARLVALLDPMEQEPVACAAVLRRARSIAALERIGTAEARALLARLAEGASTLQARTAKAALERLKARK